MSKRKLIIPVFILAIIAAGLFTGYRAFFGEADGTIQVVSPKSTTTVVSPPIMIDDDYASFSYPSSLTRQTSDAIIAPVLARYNFVKQQLGAWQVAVQISHLSGGALSDDSSYNYRSLTPDRFTRQDRTVGANKVVIFSDTSSGAFSKVAFLQQGSSSASISFIGSNTQPGDHIDADFNAMIASWHWK